MFRKKFTGEMVNNNAQPAPNKHCLRCIINVIMLSLELPFEV